jgi:putative alpha-1,2-mannosidase
MPDRMRDYAKTMLAIDREWGELPVWHLVSNDTYCMVGEPAVPVLADIILKGLAGDIDINEAYEAVCASMLPTEYAKVRRLPLRGKDYLAELGYLPYDGNEGQVVAKLTILDKISDDTPDCTEDSLKIHVHNLRRKLKAVSDTDYISAVWGIGFMLKY